MSNHNRNPNFTRKGRGLRPVGKRNQIPPAASKGPRQTHTHPTQKPILTQSGMVWVTEPGVPLAPLEVE